MQSTRVIPLTNKELPTDNKEKICFQEAVYHYPDGKADVRFRFIRKDEDGKLKAQRGQAGINELPEALELLIMMAEEKKMKFPATLVYRLQKLIEPTAVLSVFPLLLLCFRGQL